VKSWSMTEIEVRAIDQHGDVLDVLGHFPTLREARQYIPELKGETVAWVIERHTSYEWASGKPHRYKVLASGGDMNALRGGGWVPQEVAS
jgi:hypothetical protein